MKAGEKGRAGEDFAACCLRQRGFQILYRNHHCRGGELDIVAAREGILAFVEVRLRRRGGMVSPVESVTRAKCKKILAAAYDYLAGHPELRELQPRFDLFLIEAAGEDPAHGSWEHLADAFGEE